MKMIIVHDLWKRYGDHQVLKGLNLEVNEGETVVILGRSGVGKSVLLRQILGIEHPDKGYVEIQGVNVSALTANQRYLQLGAKNIGMLFQGAALFDSMNVGENTAFFLRQHERSIGESEIKKRVAEALNLVGLTDIQNKSPSDLSGGMKKRAALARLIVYRPKILLYDEPTTGLDPITSHQINELISKIQKELQATSIVVTHDIRSAMAVGDRLAFHDDGKLAYIAPKQEFWKSKNPLIHSFYENAIITSAQLDNYSNKGTQ